MFTRLPIAGAPMAGGATSTSLAIAVGAAGGLPFLAGGYKTPAALAEQIDALVASGHRFGVNLFVPGSGTIEEDAFRGYADELEPEARKYGVELGREPVLDDDDHWREKLDLVMSRPVPIVSFTFGLPDPVTLKAIADSGTETFVSVTTPEEAGRAERAGAGGLVLQGPEAGGHSATFDPNRSPSETAVAELTRAVRASSRLPIIAGGGVDGPDAVRELLDAGAQTVAVGTLLLRTEESGASDVHKDALADPAFNETVITHAFTGRPARGLRNGFIDRHEATAPVGYPEIHHLTSGIRKAAAKAGDTDSVHLWAGTGFKNATTEPAGQVVMRLAGRT